MEKDAAVEDVKIDAGDVKEVGGLRGSVSRP